MATYSISRSIQFSRAEFKEDDIQKYQGLKNTGVVIAEAKIIRRIFGDFETSNVISCPAEMLRSDDGIVTFIEGYVGKVSRFELPADLERFCKAGGNNAVVYGTYYGCPYAV